MIVCLRNAELTIGLRWYRGTAVVFERADSDRLRPVCALLEPRFLHGHDGLWETDAAPLAWAWGVAFFSTDHPFGVRPGSFASRSSERLNLLTGGGALPLALVSAVINVHGHSIFCAGEGPPPFAALEARPAPLRLVRAAME